MPWVVCSLAGILMFVLVVRSRHDDGPDCPY
jgi:hypothetical protein